MHIFLQDGRTPLAAAVDMPMWLRNELDSEGKTKRSESIPEVVRLLLEKGADVKAPLVNDPQLQVCPFSDPSVS